MLNHGDKTNIFENMWVFVFFYKEAYQQTIPTFILMIEDIGGTSYHIN